MIKRLIVAAIAITIVVALGEILTGVFLVPSTGSFPAALFIADQDRGMALRPGFNGPVIRAGHVFHVGINASGYRDNDWHTLPSGRVRVLGIGSSALFGVGIEAENSITAQLKRRSGGSADILNAGVYAYGPPQALATLRRECTSLRPAVIVYFHEYKMTRRDFLEPRRNVSTLASADPGRAERQWGLRLEALRSYASSKGLHPRQIVELMIGLDRLSPDYVRTRYMSSELPEFPETGPATAAAIIEDMATESRACGAHFIAALLPSPAEAYYGVRERHSLELLALLQNLAAAVRVVDLGDDWPLGQQTNLPGLDYFNAAAAERLSARLWPHILAVSESKSP